MKNPELYNRTVDILVDAYFNDLLIKGNCTACAIGNMVAHGLKIVVPKLDDDGDTPPYIDEVSDLTARVCTYSYSPKLSKILKKVCGYCFINLMRIENAFEGASKIHWVDYKNCSEKEIAKDQFNGLMAVVNVLDKIHKNHDTTLTAETKKKFNKQLVLNPCTL